ncbi:virion structural protein [Betalipothrixvirus uzonense]|uniref:Viral structural protein n=1 Tax=Betalipothrixvirus uzonense TaxID=512792 RepID=B2CRL7_9VIRU|nr:virion structural protein [Acidianus filamentous virus 9]ACB37274.1 viral structural protein [Acidianus filamentous virus 9]
MEIAYAVDKRNKLIEYNPKYKDLIPPSHYKLVPLNPVSSTEKYNEDAITDLRIDTLMLTEPEWLGTHPNGLLLNRGITYYSSTGSMGFIFQNYGVTAWHVAMTATYKGGESINVPNAGYFQNRRWRVHILTPPVVLTNYILKKYIFEGEYEVAIMYTNYTYPYKLLSVMGKEVCAYGVISAVLGEYTYASKLPDILPRREDCPPLKVGMKLKLYSAVSGMREGEVVSDNVEINYVANGNYILRFKKGFKVKAVSVPGDSGGAVYDSDSY